MGEMLRRRLRVKHFTGPGQEAVLALLVAAGEVQMRLDRACAEFGVTAAQYNVLRILKGGPQEGYPRGEISQRMIDRAPDVTRLVDRLEDAGLVERRRSDTDRRLSLTRITAKGAALIGKIGPAFVRITGKWVRSSGRPGVRKPRCGRWEQHDERADRHRSRERQSPGLTDPSKEDA
jgi:DNA-binding MarR family transcriptional regulator